MVINVYSYLILSFLIFDLNLPIARGFGASPAALLLLLLSLLHLRRISFSEFFNYRKVIILYLLLIMYILARLIFSGAYDTNFLATALKSTLILFITLAYLSLFKEDKKVLFCKIFNLFFINSCITFFIGYNQEYQYIANFFKGEVGELIGTNPYRNSFLSGSGYFGIGAVYGVAIPFFIYYLSKNKIFTVGNFIKLAIILFAGVMAARTVFICAMLSTVYSVLVFKNTKLLFSSIFIAFLMVTLMSTEYFVEYRLWLFEVFTANSISDTNTGNILLAYFDMEEMSFNTFLFGDGRYISNTGGYYMNVDVGYLRHFYFGGFMFAIFASLGIVLSIYFACNNKHFLFLIIPICLLLHIKGLFIYNSPAGMPMLILISYIMRNTHLELTNKTN